jgi:RNA polymerase sigma-54 factor
VERLPAPGNSLAEHLSLQLGTGRHSTRMLVLARWIIWNLDSDGYLRDDLSELSAGPRASVAELEQALALVQSLVPVGVGARSLRECLLLQILAQDDPDPLAVELIERHLKALADKRYDDLAYALGQPQDRIMRAVAAIRRLEPRPGRPFGEPYAQTVRPEVTIEKSADGYRVVLHDDDVPRIQVSPQHWAAAAAETGDSRRYLAHRLGAASRLISALAGYQQTLEAIVRSIIRWQPDFLEHGPARLRPLSLRQVATDVGVHVSTISRAVAHRYVDTPHGVFPLRSFFTNRLPGDPAGMVSPVAARQRIREMIEEEDSTRPLADSQIAIALAAAGIHIARRTVVKYRESLRIAAAPVRRFVSAGTRSFEPAVRCR